MSKVMKKPLLQTSLLHGQLQLKRGDFTLDTGSFEIPASGVTAIFGHSGSGKTTFLRCLAGFESQATGQVIFSDQAWLHNGKSLAIHKRGLGYVFQEASLFAHLNVEDNLRYGLKRAKNPRFIEFTQVVEWLGLSHLLGRNVTTLSGGERQRVAIGRTLLSQPKILMLDEPMAALDLFAKRAIMPYLERLRDELDIPILYISHSPEEVERLADTVIFMHNGKIASIEPIEQALNREDTPLYQGSEPRSVLSAEVVELFEEEGLARLKVGEAELYVPASDALADSGLNELGSNVRVVISAKQVSLMAEKPQQTSMLNHLPVTIEAIEEHNDYSYLIRLRVKSEPWPLIAQITKRSLKTLDLQVNQAWVAAIKSVSILN
ncbi:molybdenum import ATP-binding protein ModC [Thiomicrorhabdus immobilis]|uniref:Molybdenum import ATP-binding protein ModC n=1 Tax=Thiomicrorhabdus immobilis TaxID=2791037 RepID=A0ABN6CZ24_9GAMM|nr:molybdenum ABC transporter ATP-binding protein [Thiomicrorhabdus immobilis]BCN94203.1 molybdenum import ATP-binding protein ModC [Thiomicrorhabdus immobilis]